MDEASSQAINIVKYKLSDREKRKSDKSGQSNGEEEEEEEEYIISCYNS